MFLSGFEHFLAVWPIPGSPFTFSAFFLPRALASFSGGILLRNQALSIRYAPCHCDIITLDSFSEQLGFFLTFSHPLFVLSFSYHKEKSGSHNNNVFFHLFYPTIKTNYIQNYNVQPLLTRDLLKEFQDFFYFLIYLSDNSLFSHNVLVALAYGKGK